MVKIYADGADYDSMVELNDNPLISGLTTNPALMKKSGVTNYKEFAIKVLSVIRYKPVSLEVLSDYFHEMIEQALEINSWGRNVYIKIPIMTTSGESTYHVVEELTQRGVKVNVTAIMTINQVKNILPALTNTKGAYISVFAGRIADTGINPVPLMRDISILMRDNIELIWASPREVYNVYQADGCGCDIITCSQDIIKKLSLRYKDLEEFSLETVKMFYHDGQSIRFR